MRRQDTLSAEQAARRLGVKRATLYTYASRGLVRTEGAGRSRRYLASDVDALAARAAAARGHAAAASWSMNFGPPVLESAISTIGPDGPVYRGRSARSLARQGVSWERIAELLWTGSLPDAAPTVRTGLGLDARAFAALALPGSVAHVLRIAAAALPPSEEPLPWARAAARRLVAAASRAFAGDDWEARADASLAAPGLAEAVLAAVGAPDAGAVAARAVDRALVACADHELNASAFAARVAASTGADDGGILCAALAAWSGPAHGLASLAIEEGLATGTFPGVAFGQPLYPEGDPRAAELLAAAAEVGPIDVLRDWLARAHQQGFAPANVDVGLLAIQLAAGLPRGAAALIFAAGRFAGWMAHGWEQRATGQLLRPRARPRS